MAKLSSINDLAGVLGNVVGSEDPMRELRRRGFDITGDLEKALQRAKPSNQLSVAKRKQFATQAGKGKVTFRIGPPRVAVAATFAPDDYDVIAGVRLSVADQVLNGLRETQTIPQLLVLSRLLSQQERGEVVGVLRDAFATLPSGSQIGDLAIRKGISTTALNGADAVLLNLPFSLDVFRVVTVDGVSQRETLGPLTGRLRLVTRLTANMIESSGHQALRIALSVPIFFGHGGPQLEIDANSRLQPSVPGKLPLVAAKFQAALSRFMGPSLDVSPVINLPGVPGVQLVVDRVEVSAVSAPDGDLIVAGIRFAGAGAIPPDTDRLLRLRPDPGRNIVLRVHERYLKAVIRKARADGILDEIAQKEQPRTRITSTDVKFSPGQIQIFLEGVVPDACGSLDVNFGVVQTLRLVLKGNAIQIESSTEKCVSTADKILCAIMAFIVGLVVSLPFLLVAPFLGIFTALLIAADLLDLPSDSTSLSLLPLNSPVPRTELLPVLGQLTSRVGDGELISSATCTFKADTINTFIYVRLFREPVIVKSPAALAKGGVFDNGFTVPLADAIVQVCDQDAPAPKGDDVVPPKELEEETITPKFVFDESITYERPTRDQVLGQAKTDFDGRVMFAMGPGAGGGAGFEIFHKTIEDIHSHTVKTESRRTAVLEKDPDIFFLFKSQSATADSRNLPGGFMLNLRAKKVGTPTAPLQFTVRL